MSDPDHQLADPAPDPGPFWKRMAWFVGLWMASVATIFAVAYGIRFWIA